ncbi:MAG: Crp/Fnr family transcriptional regulator [Chlorobi bacterium]|nr:Crp/Fnr family transcriptional regulator [Chlorobiota bacterium]
MFTNVLRYLNSDQISDLEQNKFNVSFSQGETIFKQGAPMTHIIVIDKGLLKVYLESGLRHSIILRLLKSGEIAGGPGFHTDYRHHFSLMALEDTELTFIDINKFESFILDNSIFALEFIAYLNKAHISFYDKLKTIQHKQMNGRMAATLCYLSDNIYKSNNFETNLSRQDIADMSAMTKESAIRILKNFKDSGIIECENNTFNILNKDSLMDIFENG